MKLTRSPKIKNNTKMILLLLAIDLIIVLLYWYYQPLCEPCLDKNNCPPCLSKEQYVLIYFGLAINVLVVAILLIKRIRGINKV